MAKRKKRAKTGSAKRRKTRKAVAKKTTKRAAPRKAKKSAKKASTKLMKKPRPGVGKPRARKKKPVSASTPIVETEIIDVVEEPVPGVVTVTEFESGRLIFPDTEDEKDD